MVNRIVPILAGVLVMPFALGACGEGLGGTQSGAGSGGGEDGETAPLGILEGKLDETFASGGTGVTDIAGLNDRVIGVAL